MTGKKKGCLISIFAVFVLFIIMGILGDSESINWNNAVGKNTVKSYNEYLKMFPKGIHAAKADSFKTAS